MDERTLRVLEFHKIRERLAAATTNGLGRELAMSLEPSSEAAAVLARQRETSEAARVLSGGAPVPLGGIRDIRGATIRARAGSALGPSDLLDVACTLDAAARLRKYLLELSADVPTLRTHAEGIVPQPGLVREIRRCIDEQGNVVDSASPELSRVRAEIRVTNARIRDRLDSIIRSPEVSRYLQDPIVTMRNGRFVVPVRQECRGALGGIVHDQSSSGLTLFIEPMAVVELSNELASLEARERDEVERVLRGLSALVKGAADSILATCGELGWIDFAFAKGRLSRDMAGVEPVLDADWRLEIRQGRHPLLSGRVVPIDVELGARFRTLVITGPNTGGKTVTLKTMGLFALMTLAGLHLPAAPGTRMPVFDEVFADIGDEQSIEQNLSTFSSHMTHIVDILKRARPGSLVLLDELGAGTDPAEGASLGMAILEHLHERGALTAATTHLSELKVFAYEREGVENASCEFDTQTLQPTYRLVMGIPGSSCALAVASRLGLPPEVLEAARARLGEKHLRVDEMIVDMERQRREAEEDRQQARWAREAAERLVRERDAELRRIRETRSELLRRARDESAAIVARARREVAGILQEFRSSLAVDRAAAADDAVRRAREAMKRVAEAKPQPEEGLPTEAAPSSRPLGDGELAPGIRVFVPRLGRVGRVSRVLRGAGGVEVQLGSMKTVVPVSELAALDGDAAEGPGGDAPGGQGGSAYIAPVAREKATTISGEIDLRGKTVEEALAEVDKYLDDACLAGLARARIIHGKGTGALRQAVRDFVRQHPLVESATPGGPGEGGDGVTVVAIRAG